MTPVISPLGKDGYNAEAYSLFVASAIVDPHGLINPLIFIQIYQSYQGIILYVYVDGCLI
jgi:hypothetical protein